MNQVDFPKFMWLFTKKCCEFYQDMYNICSTYQKVIGGTQADGSGKGKNKSLSFDGKTKSIKKKRNKDGDPNMPRRPPSAYLLYFSEKKQSFIDKFPDLQITEISRLIGNSWRQLTEQQKDEYLKKADSMQSQYRLSMIEYQKTHPEVKVPGERSEKKKKKKLAEKQAQQALQMQQSNLLNSEEEEMGLANNQKKDAHLKAKLQVPIQPKKPGEGQHIDAAAKMDAIQAEKGNTSDQAKKKAKTFKGATGKSDAMNNQEDDNEDNGKSGEDNEGEEDSYNDKPLKKL